MWPSDSFSQCPKCRELTYEFDRDFPDLLTHSRRVYFPVLAYYCPACDQVIVELFHSEDDRDVFVCSHDRDWRVAAPATPPRPHPAYNPDRISLRAIVYHARLEFYRSVRQTIGRIVHPDDPVANLEIPKPFDFDVETLRGTLDAWLRNTRSGAASKLTTDSSHVVVHLAVTNRLGLGVQLGRLRRRFALPAGTKLYYFNEGRRYAAQNVE